MSDEKQMRLKFLGSEEQLNAIRALLPVEDKPSFWAMTFQPQITLPQIEEAIERSREAAYTAIAEYKLLKSYKQFLDGLVK